MVKSLRGKECGKGICQRKDGLYSARFVSSEGKRQVKCFSSLPEARNWLKDAKYADRHEDVFAPPDMTVTEWFEFWISHIVGDLAPNTKRTYRERYEHNVKPVIGKMRLTDVKPMHCKMVFNRMEASDERLALPSPSALWMTSNVLQRMSSRNLWKQPNDPTTMRSMP